MDRQEYELRLQNPKYKELKVTTFENGVDYVFISYCSNSWEKVLTDIVYRLQKDYHLRIYFDKDFSTENKSWVKQFQQNMASSHCKAVLCFMDTGYVSSYAALMELMYARSPRCELKDNVYTVNFDITKLDADTADADTGLGMNGSKLASEEKEAFERMLRSLTRNNNSPYAAIEDFYDKDSRFRVIDCYNMMKILAPEHKRIYSDKSEFLEDNLVKALKKHVPSVFEEATPAAKVTPTADSEPSAPTVAPGPAAQNGTITLIDFLKKYNNSTFKKSTYAKFRLVGSNGNERYTTEYSDSAFDLVWNFVMSLIREKGMDYINAVNEKHSGLKNPVFISQEEYEKRNDQLKYRRIDVDGLNSYYMYRHYGQFQWIDTVLKPRLMEFGLRLEDFSFEFIIGDEGPETNVQNPVQVCAMPVEQSDATANAVPSQTVETQKNSFADVFTYSLWGEQHTAKTLSGMMHDVFDLIAEKYASDIPAMAHDNRISALALMQDVDEQKLPPNKLSYFRVKKAHSVDGEQYYVGTSYNRQQGIAQLKKMLEICEGSADGLNIFSSPQKSAHENKGGKKGIGEIL